MRKIFWTSLALAAFAAAPAWAHPGHGAESSFASGFSHPFSGLDHLLVMAAIGVWAGLSSHKLWWAWPAAFVTFMLSGFTYGLGGGSFPGAEAAILASVIGLGLVLLLNVRISLGLGAALIAFFAAAHGFAHGAEMPASAQPLRFALGFGAATLILHVLGLICAWGILRWPGRPFARAAGAGLTAAGLMLAIFG
ncbi:MAG: HupE/UreJ family protein [Caulobacterales bacterium]